MCGRFFLVTDLAKIASQFDVRGNFGNFQANWNITPGQYIPAVIQRDGQNILESFLWGLIPAWAKDPSPGHKLFNARGETLGEKPSFRNAFKARRCLIVADGFYEWKQEGKKKIPLRFYLQSGKSFGMAGLYETWLSPAKKQINTCTIITTDANELIKPIHDRMPVIVSGDKEKIWISNKIENGSDLMAVLKPYPADEMNCQIGLLSGSGS